MHSKFTPKFENSSFTLHSLSDDNAIMVAFLLSFASQLDLFFLVSI